MYSSSPNKIALIAQDARKKLKLYIELEIKPACSDYGLGLIPYSPEAYAW